MIEDLVVSTPGRVCLFGEHQDYLGLPVIPAAISRRMIMRATRRGDDNITIQLPDVCRSESFSLRGSLSYTTSNDYFRSGLNVLRRHGFTFSTGLDCRVTSEIPINAGTSSSSALVVGWVNVLARMSDQRIHLRPSEMARYAFEAEVLEFNEAGGMMDQYSTAHGGVIVLDFDPDFRCEPMRVDLGAFVLGDSGKPKDTQHILLRVKNGVQNIVTRLWAKQPSFSIMDLTAETVVQYKNELTAEQFSLLEGTIRNHEITLEARRILSVKPLDHKCIGQLLTKHHAVLRDVQRISTPKIDRMLDAALAAGAYGGKINGSGGGGCMFAYAPENAEKVAEAIERAGGQAHIVYVDVGSRDDTKNVQLSG